MRLWMLIFMASMWVPIWAPIWEFLLHPFFSNFCERWKKHSTPSRFLRFKRQFLLSLIPFTRLTLLVSHTLSSHWTLHKCPPRLAHKIDQLTQGSGRQPGSFLLAPQSQSKRDYQFQCFLWVQFNYKKVYVTWQHSVTDPVRLIWLSCK